jgi:hypothetical protein
MTGSHVRGAGEAWIKAAGSRNIGYRPLLKKGFKFLHSAEKLIGAQNEAD